MKAGLWIDHRKAVIAIVAGGDVETSQIDFHEESRVRHLGATCDIHAEDQRERRFASHLNQYYGEVVEAVRNAETILIMGPGEAKREFAERLAREGLTARIGEIRTADKLTDRQIAAAVRKHFHKKN